MFNKFRTRRLDLISPEENLDSFLSADKLLPKGCWNCRHEHTDDLAHCVKCAPLGLNEDPSIRGGWEPIL